MAEAATALARAVHGAAVTREVTLDAGALAALPAVARRHVPAATLLVVADDRTWEAAGRRAAALLAGDGRTVEWLVLPGTPRLKPATDHADAIAARIAAGAALPVAVGSGVVNDLVKRAAGVTGVPYLVVATAASMDGYAASGAALHEDGFKRTFPCPPPVAVVADIDVVATAPARMAAWGYGDLAGKIVAGADWIVADALEEEAIAAGPFGLVQENLQDWLAAPERLRGGARDALRGLMEGLLVTGFAMQAHGTSRPASGSDHQFSHLWEMEGLSVDGEPVAHGACVGVGCVAMLALYEWLLAQAPTGADIAPALARHPTPERIAAEVAAAFPGSPIAGAAAIEATAKHPTPERLRRRLERLVAIWPTLRARLAPRLPSAREMRRRLAACGGPGHPEEIGIDLATLAADCRRARLIRRRYTALDLLADLGWLDRAIAATFAPGVSWSRGEALRAG
ncbi:MAG: iron-containing alcohol dehydrogenase [Alphaproteobacteria bacterium]|nr:iron-containing alcohol dehydrogenase [Alphaproteobacteria bacterium]